MKRTFHLAAAAALFSAGCVPMGARPWPSGSPDAPRSGVLFKLKADRSSPDYAYGGVTIHAPSLSGGAEARLTVDGVSVNKFPYDVVLMSLPPGEYAPVTVESMWAGYQQHWVATRPAGAFSRFKLKPGKIAVLGE